MMGPEGGRGGEAEDDKGGKLVMQQAFLKDFSSLKATRDKKWFKWSSHQDKCDGSK